MAEVIIITNSQGTWQGLYDTKGNLQWEGEALGYAEVLGMLSQPYKELTRDEAWLARYGGRMPQTFSERTDVLGNLQAERQSLLNERDRIGSALVEINKRIQEAQNLGSQAAPKA